MIRKISVILIVLACVLAAPAFAIDDDYRTYLTLGGGMTLLQETEQNHSVLADTITITGSEKGYNGFIATGLAYDVGRVEFALGYNNAEFEEYEDSIGSPPVSLEGNIQILSFLMSVFWDFNTDGAVSPYFGLGIGGCQIKMDDTILGENRDAALAYQAGLGVSFNMGENTQFDLGYKMLSVVEPNLGPIDPSYLVTHNGNAAFRFLF